MSTAKRSPVTEHIQVNSVGQRWPGQHSHCYQTQQSGPQQLHTNRMAGERAACICASAIQCACLGSLPTAGISLSRTFLQHRLE